MWLLGRGRWAQPPSPAEDSSVGARRAGAPGCPTEPERYVSGLTSLHTEKENGARKRVGGSRGQNKGEHLVRSHSEELHLMVFTTTRAPNKGGNGATWGIPIHLEDGIPRCQRFPLSGTLHIRALTEGGSRRRRQGMLLSCLAQLGCAESLR